MKLSKSLSIKLALELSQHIGKSYYQLKYVKDIKPCLLRISLSSISRRRKGAAKEVSGRTKATKKGIQCIEIKLKRVELKIGLKKKWPSP
jgi:hypothetical protein